MIPRSPSLGDVMTCPVRRLIGAGRGARGEDSPLVEVKPFNRGLARRMRVSEVSDHVGKAHGPVVLRRGVLGPPPSSRGRKDAHGRCDGVALVTEAGRGRGV